MLNPLKLAGVFAEERVEREDFLVMRPEDTALGGRLDCLPFCAQMFKHELGLRSSGPPLTRLAMLSMFAFVPATRFSVLRSTPAWIGLDCPNLVLSVPIVDVFNHLLSDLIVIEPREESPLSEPT